MKVNRRLLRKTRKIRNKMYQQEQRTRYNQVLTKAKKTSTDVNVASTREGLTSKNPIKRKLAQWRDESQAKHEAKLESIKAKGELAKIKPELALQQQRAESAVKIHKAKGHAKIASSAAIASGMSNLGQGLSDERNQDDSKERQADENIARILGGSGESGLAKGVE